MRRLCVVFALLLLAGCSILDTKVERGYSEDGSWSSFAGNTNNPTGSTFTTADVRIITQRMHPVLHNPILCVEPSPDVADALSSAAGLTAQGGTTTVSGNLSISGASSEAVAELAGRSTALLGLRDGLFEACEAYANGAIGQDAYSLILSVYGQLMTTLFLAQDVTNASSAQPGAMASSPTIQQPSGSNTGGGGTGSTSKTGAKTSNTNDDTAPIGQPHVILAVDEAGLPIQPIAKASPASQPASNGAATPNKGTSSTADKQVASGVGGNASAATPLSIVRMLEDYMHPGLVGVLLVACINEYDPTRNLPDLYQSVKWTPDGTPDLAYRIRAINPWLDAVCRNLETTGALADLEKADAAARAAGGFKAVDPTSAAIAAPSSPPKTTTPTKSTIKPAKMPTSPITNIARLLPAASAEGGARNHCGSPPLKKPGNQVSPGI